MRAHRLFGVVSAVALLGCNSILSIDDHALAPDGGSSLDGTVEGSASAEGGGSSGGGPDAAPGESGPDTGGTTTSDSGSDGAGRDGTSADGGGEAGGCGTCPLDHPTCVGGQCTVRGPTMVAIPNPEGGAGFFIDSTEVTMAQYSLFVAAKGSDTSGQPSVCAWNSSYAPTSGVDNTTVPVTNIDWCDAYAYCAWAGKHLCGSMQSRGGPLAIADAFDQTKSQWFLACGGVNGNSHPSVADVCNSNFGTANLAPVATYPGCEGYYAGLFDLEGNAAEWVDSCDSQGADGGAGDICHLLGGSISDQSSYCDESYDWPRNEAAYPFGFRCCGG